MSVSVFYIITGAQGEGKSTRCLSLANQLRKNDEKVGGLIAVGYWKDGVRSAFDLLDLSTNLKQEFASREEKENWKAHKSFYFNPKTIQWGKAVLEKAVAEKDWIILDEIGKIDMSGELWGEVFSKLQKIPNKKWILSVRNLFVEDVIQHWNLKNTKVLQITDHLIF
ncbi:MAG: hypothetical protein JW729_07675 [Bacteroidales bacterium]|nr:hypothetical protein [Bacteroidales bacterium]